VLKRTWLSSQVADVFDTGTRKFIPDTTSASVPLVTTLRSSLRMFLYFIDNLFSLSLFVLLTAQRRLLSE
jgi:hypothetical protein